MENQQKDTRSLTRVHLQTVIGRNRKLSRYKHTKYIDQQKRKACIQGVDKNTNRSEFDNNYNKLNTMVGK